MKGSTISFTNSPVRQLLNVSEVLDMCPDSTCQNRCGQPMEDCGFHECNCDRRCLLFKDCCPDFRETCPEEAISLGKSEEESYFKIMPYVTVDQMVDNGTISWVSRCPSGAHANLAGKCETLTSFSASTSFICPCVYWWINFQKQILCPMPWPIN